MVRGFALYMNNNELKDSFFIYTKKQYKNSKTMWPNNFNRGLLKFTTLNNSKKIKKGPL